MGPALQGSPAGLQGGAPVALQGSPVALQPTVAPTGGQILTNPSGQPTTTDVPTPTASVLTNGSSSGSSYDPNATAYYTDVINQLTSQLQGAQAEEPTGLNNIQQAFNDSQNQLNQGETNAETGYNTQRATNGQQREQNMGTINMDAGQAFQSLMALLGAAGSSVSSAARYGAPEAVAKNASSQRSGADMTYNTNNSAINTAEGATQEQYQNALKDLLTQKNTSTQNFESGLLNTEGTLQQQIRDAQINRAEYGGQPYSAAASGAGNTTQAINDIQAKLSQIFKQYASPTFTVNPVTPTTPNIANYNVDPATVAVQNANPTTDSSFLPYLASLKQNNNGNPVLTGGAAPTSATAITAGAK